jgi:hypothetical protein
MQCKSQPCASQKPAIPTTSQSFHKRGANNTVIFLISLTVASDFQRLSRTSLYLLSSILFGAQYLDIFLHTLSELKHSTKHPESTRRISVTSTYDSLREPHDPPFPPPVKRFCSIFRQTCCDTSTTTSHAQSTSSHKSTYKTATMKRNIVIAVIIIVLFILLTLLGFLIWWIQNGFPRRGGGGSYTDDEESNH